MLDQLSPLIEDHGSIVAYNAGFETQRLQDAADAFPGYIKWLEGVSARIVDLCSPFRSRHIYCPSQHGSASLKRVLPALAGKNYHSLEYQEGAEASQEFLRITFGDVPEEERQNVRQNLEAYCGLDTMGMLDIIRVLWNLAIDSEHNSFGRPLANG